MTVRTQYEADLTALKAALVEMGQNSADAVEAALEALCTADAAAAAAIVKDDGRINNMERDIEHRCMTLLLRQQPVAGDLRRISTAMPPTLRRSSPTSSPSAGMATRRSARPSGWARKPTR